KPSFQRTFATSCRLLQTAASLRNCLREAGAGGSNPLTPTSISDLNQQLTSPSDAFPVDRLFPRKPHGSPARKFTSISPPMVAPRPATPTRVPSSPAPPRPARPRGKALAPRDSPPPDRPAQTPRPVDAGRIARPSAGSGSHLPRTRDRGVGFPPTGGSMGPIAAGGPRQTFNP